jgi:hypothetical protein
LQVSASGVLVPHGAEAAGAWQRSAQQLAQDYLVKQVGPVAAVVLPCTASLRRHRGHLPRSKGCLSGTGALDATLLSPRPQGIDLGRVELLLEVRPCEGLVRSVEGVVERRWARAAVPVPLQAVLRQEPKRSAAPRPGPPGPPRVLALPACRRAFPER